VNQEGRDDRDYFSDWGGCTCTEDEDNDQCPFWDGDEGRCARDDDFEEEED